MATLTLDADQCAACDALSELVCMVLRDDACEMSADQPEFSYDRCSGNVSDAITIRRDDIECDVDLTAVSDDEYDPMNPGIGGKNTCGIGSRTDVTGNGNDLGENDIAHFMNKIMPFLPKEVVKTISGIFRGALRQTPDKGPINLNVETSVIDAEDFITVIDDDAENAACRPDDPTAEQYLNDPEVHWAILNAVQMYYNSLSRAGRFFLSARKRDRRGNIIFEHMASDSRSEATIIDLCDDEHDDKHCNISTDEFGNEINIVDLDSYDNCGDLRTAKHVKKLASYPHDRNSDIAVIDCNDRSETINNTVIRSPPHDRELITDDDDIIEVVPGNEEKICGEEGGIINCEGLSRIVNDNINSRDVNTEWNVKDVEMSKVVVTGASNDSDAVVVGNCDKLLRDREQLSESLLLDTDNNSVEFDSAVKHGVYVDLDNASNNHIGGHSIPVSNSKPAEERGNKHDIHLSGVNNGINIVVDEVDKKKMVWDIGFDGNSGGNITDDHHSKDSESGRKRRRNRDLRLAINRKSNVSFSKRPKLTQLIRDGDTTSEILKLKALQRNLQSSSQFLVEEESTVDVDSDPIEFSDISDAENVNLEIGGDDFDDELKDGGSATASSDDQFEPEFVGTIVPEATVDPIQNARIVELKERSSDKTFKPHRVKRRKSGPNSLPERYEKYSPIGTRIGNTRFVCFKTPLKRELCRRLKHRDNWFTPDELFRRIVSKGHELGMVIDLTATSRFYNCEEITFAGVEYKKICCPDTSIPPESCVKRFFNGIAEYESKFANRDPLIGVHCCNGVNTTGYFVCRYMIEELGYCADGAIASFNAARGHVIEKQEIIDSLFALDKLHRSNCTHMIRYLDDELDHELVSTIRPPESVTLPETENETSDGIDEDEEGENAELEILEKDDVSTGRGIMANLDGTGLDATKEDTLSKVGSCLRYVRSGRNNIDGKSQQLPKSSKIVENSALINSDEDDESSLIGGVRSPRPSSEEEAFDGHDDVSEIAHNQNIQVNVRKISESAIMKKNKTSLNLEKSQVRVNGKTSQSVGRGKMENILQLHESPEKSSYSSSSSTSDSSGSGSSDSDSGTNSNFSDVSNRSRTKIRQVRRDKKRQIVTTILRKRQVGNGKDMLSTKQTVSPKPAPVTAASIPHTEMGQRAFVTQFMTACLATMYQNQQLIIAMNKKKLIADKMVMAVKAKSQTVVPTPPPAPAKSSSSSANQEIDPRFSKWVAIQEKKRAAEAAMAAAAPPQASLDNNSSVAVEQEVLCNSGKDHEHSATLIVDSVDGIPVLPSPAIGSCVDVQGASSSGVIVDSVDGIPVLPARECDAARCSVKGASVGSVDGIPVLPSRVLRSSSNDMNGAPSNSDTLVTNISRNGRSNCTDLLTGNNCSIAEPAVVEGSKHAGYVEPPNVVPVPLPLGAIRQLNPPLSRSGPIRGIPHIFAQTPLPQSIAPEAKLYPNSYYSDYYGQSQYVQPLANADFESAKSVGVLQPKAMSGYEALQYYQMQTAKRIDLERLAPAASSYSVTSSVQIAHGGTVTTNGSAKPASFVSQKETSSTSIESVVESNLLGRSDQDYRQGFDYRRGIGITTDPSKANEDAYSSSTKFTAPIPSLLPEFGGGLSKIKKLPSLMDINPQSIPGYSSSRTAQEPVSVAAKPSSIQPTNVLTNLHQVRPELYSTTSVISQHDSIGLPTVSRSAGSGRLPLGHEYRALAPNTWRGFVDEQHVTSGVGHIAGPQPLTGGYRGSFGDSIHHVIPHPTSAVGEVESAAAYYVRTGLPPPIDHLSRPSGGQSGYQHMVQEAIKGVLGLADGDSDKQNSNKTGTEDVENQRISLDERLKSIMNDESSLVESELHDCSERQYKNY